MDELRDIQGFPGYKQQEIAEAFGVTRRTVSDIKTGRSWGWLKSVKEN